MTDDRHRSPPQDDIHALGRWADDHLAAHWQEVLDTHRDKLADAYARAGDAAYGTYQHLLLRDLKRQLREAGLTATPPLPGDFMTSREWGNADQTDQERWMWSTIHAASGQALGTLVHVIPHDHTRFHVPRRPEMLGVDEIDRGEVEAVLGTRSDDFAVALPFHEWYAQYLAGHAER
ncbi:DUF6022 family protein [Deinococcus yunweiensis]|uniref:DUF6022 family protein n=1 Tax=Deinococcus yunweiensis TaxID=367282 RepID=UPI00398E7D31